MCATLSASIANVLAGFPGICDDRTSACVWGGVLAAVRPLRLVVEVFVVLNTATPQQDPHHGSCSGYRVAAPSSMWGLGRGHRDMARGHEP